VYARLLLESLRRGTRRKLLALTAVGLGTLGATALGEVLLASGDRLADELSSYGANLEVTPARAGGLLAADRLVALRHIFWRNNIVAVAPILPLRLRMGVPGSSSQVIETLATWFDHPLDATLRSGLPRTRPTLKITGRWPREADQEIVLGNRTAARLGAKIGDRILVELESRALDLTVVGTVQSGGDEDDQALLPLSVATQLTGQPAAFTRAEVFAQTNPERGNRRDPRSMTRQEYDSWYCTAYPSSVAFQIGQALPDAHVAIATGLTQATAEVLGRLRSMLLGLAIVALLGAAVGAAAAMTATVLERRLEVGLLVAIGAARRQIVGFFLSEAALLGGIGGLTGGLLGLAGGRLLGTQVLGISVPLLPVLLPVAMVLGVAVALFASLLPVSRALAGNPATLLKRADA
jgi:putative ABC transport system permease protein